MRELKKWVENLTPILDINTVDSGDWGNWNIEDEDVYMACMIALKKAENISFRKRNKLTNSVSTD
jgi:hypothetical protein